jgi:hypothetical protein
MKKFFLFCLIVLSTSFVAKAQDFLEPNSDGDTIAYTITDSINHYVEVSPYIGEGSVYQNRHTHYSYYYSLYKDTLTIPPYVIHDGIEYTVKSIGYRAFFNCTYDAGHLYYDYHVYGLYKVNLPSTIDTIKEDVFSCRLEMKNIILPNSIKYIGRGTFAGGYPEYGHAFYTAYDLWKDLIIDMPDSVTEIHPYTFFNTILKDSNINSLLTDNIRKIDSFAFAFYRIPSSWTRVDTVEWDEKEWEEAWDKYKWEHLDEIKEKGIATVKEQFRQWTRYVRTSGYYPYRTSLRLPSNLEYLEHGAFQNKFFDTIFVTSLTPPIVTGTPFLIYDNYSEQVDSYYKFTILIVPCQSYSLYKTADYWKNFDNIQCMYDPTSKIVVKPNIDYFDMYPNPTDEILFFKYEDTIQKANVYNIEGDKLISKRIDDSSGYLDVCRLKAGQYILQLIFEDKTISKVFIKK